MKKFFVTLLANSVAFYYGKELFDSNIQEENLRLHAVYGLGAVLLLFTPAILAMKCKICGSKKQSRHAHGLFQFLGAVSLLYSAFNAYQLYEKFGKAHAWNFSDEEAFSNVIAKAHGLLGTFLTTIISLLCLVVPLKMGPGASDEVLQKEGPQHAIAGKIIFTLLNGAVIVGSYLALGYFDAILCVCILVSYSSVILPEGSTKKVEENKKQQTKKSN